MPRFDAMPNSHDVVTKYLKARDVKPRFKPVQYDAMPKEDLLARLAAASRGFNKHGMAVAAFPMGTTGQLLYATNRDASHIWKALA